MVAIDLKHLLPVHFGAYAAAMLALWLIHRWRSDHDVDYDRDHGTMQLGVLGLAWMVANQNTGARSAVCRFSRRRRQ
jgi:hypothetical protein